MAGEKVLKPETNLSDNERALLYSLVASDGFKVLQQLMEDEVQKFTLALINAEASKDAEVLSAHKMAKASAQFYAGLLSRLRFEVELYKSAGQSRMPQDDPTREVIDMGETAQALSDFVGQFGGDDIL